jgi:hypothetical protein
MIRLARLLLAAVLAFGAMQAQARTPVPVVNYENVVLQRANGAPLSAADIKRAIQVAADATGRKWIISESAPGVLLATYQVRTHSVTTEIRYGATGFSVFYRDSSNMKYGSGPGGVGVIHPFYNQWVQEFVSAIRIEAQKA